MNLPRPTVIGDFRSDLDHTLKVIHREQNKAQPTDFSREFTRPVTVISTRFVRRGCVYGMKDAGVQSNTFIYLCQSPAYGGSY
jgi:hypothetical protein